MKIFITSDTYFGRESIALKRGFESSEHMEDEIIDKWNSKVGINDIVYHLGNFGWDPISTESAMAHLNGKIFFIPGQYDKHLSEMSLIKVGRHQMLPVIAEFPSLNLVVSHWALTNWNNKEGGAIHVHGGEKEEHMDSRFCANIANWNYSPIEFDFLKELITNK